VITVIVLVRKGRKFHQVDDQLVNDYSSFDDVDDTDDSSF
jgi:hypothetical protein